MPLTPPPGTAPVASLMGGGDFCGPLTMPPPPTLGPGHQGPMSMSHNKERSRWAGLTRARSS